MESLVDRKSGEEPKYSQAHLLDVLIGQLRVKNDRALALRLEVPAPTISKVRNDRIPLSAHVLLSMHEESDLPIATLRSLAGDGRPHTGRSAGPAPVAKHPNRKLTRGGRAAGK
jgi:hypothetical protein